MALSISGHRKTSKSPTLVQSQYFAVMLFGWISDTLVDTSRRMLSPMPRLSPKDRGFLLPCSGVLTVRLEDDASDPEPSPTNG
jgi:hypothetical protein